MSQESPVAILYDFAGNALAVANGVAIPAGTPGLLAMGSDGTNSRFLTVDSSGRAVVAGGGTAGTPVGGVLSVQGVSGGQPLPISGTVTVTIPANGTTGSAQPTSADLMGASDGTNLQALRAFDLDTGAGFEWDLGVSIRIPGAGGSVAGGTSTNPLRFDPTGTTTQPISAAALPLPTGAATEATLGTLLTTTGFQARINTLGQKTASASTPVVLASDQTSIPVTMQKSATSTTTSVAASATSVSLLASNTSRVGATIYNDSTKLMYLKLGTTASTTSFTTVMRQGDYFEVPYGYTGAIEGIWTSATGSARISELT